ncbi:MAG: KdsC family phosphatase [Muribaculaceae bacterium]
MSKINHPLTNIRAIAFDVDGVLSPTLIPMNENGVPMRMANLKDGYALQFAVKCGLKIAIISGANTESLRTRYGALGITDIYLSAAHKLPILQKWMQENGLNPQDVAYCGDDIPDIPPMQVVGLPVAPADAAVEVKQAAGYITSAMGGYGVARELLEQILRAQGKWMQDTKAFGW